MKQLVIFDLDGTLLNTIDDLGTAANHALARAGFPTHHISSYPHFVGNGISKLIERVLPVEDRNEATVTTLRRDFVEYYDQHLTDMTHPYPGIHELLYALTDRGIELAVVSNKYQSAAETIIRHFFPEIPWVEIMGQRPDYPVKPDPSMVFAVLAQHPVAKSDILFVGDSKVDIETARRVGVESIGVTWGFRSVSELRAAYADHIVDTPEAILAIATSPSPY